MMISEPTQQQLAELKISATKPLLISDVDEVIVHFIREFEEFIGKSGLSIKPGNPAEPYHVFEIKTGQPIANTTTFDLVNEFFVQHTRGMKAIDGAVESLNALSKHATVVMLTNLPHFAGDDRRANLAMLGLDFPVITNSGPKGPALREIAARTNAPVVFIDDSQHFIQSAFDHAPNVHLIHFLHDERFSKFVPELDFVSLRSDNWSGIKSHASKLLEI
jgi:hypothetical protein